MVTLINRRSRHATAATTTTTSSSSAAVEIDQLSRLPDEIVVQILTKLDMQSLGRCTAVSRRFLPLVPQIPSLSTALPPSLIIGKPDSPESTSPVPSKFFFVSIALLLCLPLLYFATRLFFGHHPYSWLALIAAVPAVRRFLNRFVVLLLFLVLIPLSLFISLILTIITPLMRFLYNSGVSMFFRILPRVSDSGREFFMRLTRLNSLDVTFPPLWYDHPRLWIRGETKLIGPNPYVIFLAGDVVDQFEELGVLTQWGSFLRFLRLHTRVALRVFQLTRLLNLFPIAMNHSRRVVRNVFSKSEGSNTKARFYFEEGIERSFEVRLDGAKERVPRYCHLRSCTLSLNGGTLQLQDLILAFFFFPDSHQGHVVDKDFILACLDDTEEGGDYERKELREAVRVILSTPGLVIGDSVRWQGGFDLP